MSSRSEKTIRQIRQILQTSQDFERSERDFSQNSPFSCYLSPRANLYNQYPFRTTLNRRSPKKSPKKKKSKKTTSGIDSRPFLFNNNNPIYRQLSNSAKKAFLPDSNLQNTSVQTSLGLILDQSDSDPLTAKQNEIMSFITIGDNLLMKRFFNRWRQRWFFKTAYIAHQLIHSAGIRSIKHHLKRSLLSSGQQSHEGRENIEAINNQNQIKSRSDTRQSYLISKRDSPTVKNRLTQTEIQNRTGNYDENGYNTIFNFDEDYEYYEYDDDNDKSKRHRVYIHRHSQTRPDIGEELEDEEYNTNNSKRNKSVEHISQKSKVHQSNKQRMSHTVQNDRSSKKYQSMDQNNRRSTSNDLAYNRHNSTRNDEDYQYNNNSMQNNFSQNQSRDNQNFSDYSNASLIENSTQKRESSTRKDSYLVQTSKEINNRQSIMTSPIRNKQNNDSAENQNYSDYSNTFAIESPFLSKTTKNISRIKQTNESHLHSRTNLPNKLQSKRYTNNNHIDSDYSTASFNENSLQINKYSTQNNSSRRNSPGKNESMRKSQPNQIDSDYSNSSFNENSLQIKNFSTRNNSSRRNSPGKKESMRKSQLNKIDSGYSNDSINDGPILQNPIQSRRKEAERSNHHHSQRNASTKTNANAKTDLDDFDYSNASFDDDFTLTNKQQTSANKTTRNNTYLHHSFKNSSTKTNLINVNTNLTPNYSESSIASINDNPILISKQQKTSQSTRHDNQHHSQRNSSTKTKINSQIIQNEEDYSNASFNDSPILINNKQKTNQSTRQNNSFTKSTDNQHHSRTNLNSQTNQNQSDYSNASFNDNTINQQKVKNSTQNNSTLIETNESNHHSIRNSSIKNQSTENQHHSFKNSSTKTNLNSQINKNDSDYSDASFNDNKQQKSTRKDSSQIRSSESHHHHSQYQSQVKNSKQSIHNNSENNSQNNLNQSDYSNYSKTEQETNNKNHRSSSSITKQQQMKRNQTDINIDEVNSKTFSPIKTPQNFDDVVSQIIPDLDEFIQKYSSKRTSTWSLEDESDAELKTIIERSKFYHSKYSHIKNGPNMIPVNTNLTPDVSMMNKKFDTSLPELHEFDYEMTQGKVAPPLYFNNQI